MCWLVNAAAKKLGLKSYITDLDIDGNMHDNVSPRMLSLIMSIFTTMDLQWAIPRLKGQLLSFSDTGRKYRFHKNPRTAGSDVGMYLAYYKNFMSVAFIFMSLTYIFMLSHYQNPYHITLNACSLHSFIDDTFIWSTEDLALCLDINEKTIHLGNLGHFDMGDPLRSDALKQLDLFTGDFLHTPSIHWEGVFTAKGARRAARDSRKSYDIPEPQNFPNGGGGGIASTPRHLSVAVDDDDENPDGLATAR